MEQYLRWCAAPEANDTCQRNRVGHFSEAGSHILIALDALPARQDIVYASIRDVVLAKWYFGYGNCIIINHAGGYSTLYGHLRLIKSVWGDLMRQGQVIEYG